MLASEVIKELQALIEEHGDLKVGRLEYDDDDIIEFKDIHLGNKDIDYTHNKEEIKEYFIVKDYTES